VEEIYPILDAKNRGATFNVSLSASYSLEEIFFSFRVCKI
jgi:hypothetical protein